jgi:hypothetical protein
MAEWTEEELYLKEGLDKLHNAMYWGRFGDSKPFCQEQEGNTIADGDGW